MSDIIWQSGVKIAALPAQAKALLRIHSGQITHPPVTSRWFRTRERLSAWIAPPMPIGSWTTVTLRSDGKVRVEER